MKKKKITKLIRDYFADLHRNKFENISEIDNLLGISTLPKLKYLEIRKLKIQSFTEELESY